MKTNEQLIIKELEMLNKKMENIEDKLVKIEKKIKEETLTTGLADSVAAGFSFAVLLLICIIIYSFISSFFH